MKKNDQFELDITDISDEGAGIGKKAGFVWFVKDALPGDRVRAAATKLKKNYGFARLLEVLSPSEDRREAPCPVARQCGGCQLQAMSYEAQLRFKERKVLNNLKRIGGFEGVEALSEPIIGMENPFRYRNKAQFPVGRDRDGRIIAGFYAGRTHHIVECRDCLLGPEENQRILQQVTDWMEAYGIPAYDETQGKGIVRHVLIRKGYRSGQIMVCLVINGEKLPHSQELVEALRSLPLPEGEAVASISYSINQANTNVIMGDRIVDLFGPGYIEDSIRGLEAESRAVTFRISPLSFYQVNPVQMERLYSTALEYAGLTGKETVWDLYCGIGTISLFLAQKAKKVYGVEIIPQAIQNARENAELNGIQNAEFYVGKAEEVLPRWYEEQQEKAKKEGFPEAAERIDVIVVDPPRKGCDEKCLETILKLQPERVVYVSCDSATLARDLKYLCANGYKLTRVRPCDMFPETVHCECVVRLERRIWLDRRT